MSQGMLGPQHTAWNTVLLGSPSDSAGTVESHGERFPGSET